MTGHRVVSISGYKSDRQSRSTPAQTKPRKEWQETWSDYASHTGTSARQRFKLVAKGLAHRLQSSAKDARHSGRKTAKKIGIRVALLTSHTLVEIADRIERRARKMQDNHRE